MRRSLQPRGFTLVELLVSMAIALLLIVGVNAVFSTTAKTVGAGQSLLSAGRDARTFLQTMYVDMNEVDPVAIGASTIGDPICFIIQSSHVYAFRNFDDQQGAASPVTPANPSQDTSLFPTGSPLFPGNTAPVPFVHFRSHRVDKLGFFARGLFARQTSSNSTSYTSATSSSEAWIVYEHATQPNKLVINNTSNSPSNWFLPGAPNQSGSTNDYNYFASDWMLARLAILLVPTPNSATDPVWLSDPQISGGSSTLSTGLMPLCSGGTSTSNNPGVPPLPSGSQATRASAAIGSEGSAALIYSSRLDIAQTSIYNFGYLHRPNGLASYGYTINSMGAFVPNANNGVDWWDPMIAQRIWASPYLLTPMGTAQTAPKLDPYGLATSAPSLVRGCTQFIVEYAGNFYTKDPVVNNGSALNPQVPANPTAIPPTSAIFSPVPDPSGQLDYFIDSNGNRRIRWYGFPRLVLLSNTSGAPPVIDATYGTAGNSAIDAVVPLRDVLDKLTPSGVTPTWGAMNPNANPAAPTALYADAERFPTGFPACGSNYWQAMVPATDQTTPYTYTAAWGPDIVHQPFPKMIRIVICIDDHEGRLSQPQFYEYIFDVQP